MIFGWRCEEDENIRGLSFNWLNRHPKEKSIADEPRGVHAISVRDPTFRSVADNANLTVCKHLLR